ncbi:putative uncharacterized protein [Clostridium sp. CAG:1013]|nr:putative uncharacterized protein [Clostridium sp. CAG:1013]
MAEAVLKSKTGRKIRRTTGDVIFDTILYVITGLMILVTLYPMYFIVIASISSPTEVASGNITFFPKGFSLKGYKELFNYAQLWSGYGNTILYAFFGTVFSLVVNIPAAYSLSRKDLVGRRIFTIFFLIPMFFTGGLIPTYMTVQSFGLVDTRLVMVLPFAVVTYYIIVARTFFSNSLPDGLYEAAQIDGCGNLRFFFKWCCLCPKQSSP